MIVRALKKLVMWLSLCGWLFVCCVTPLRASEDTGYLAAIKKNTESILSAVNSLPLYITHMIQFAIGMQMADNSDSTQNMQVDFAQIGNTIVSNSVARLVFQSRLNQDFTQSLIQDKQALPRFVNDLTYSTVIGMPILSPDPRLQSSSDHSVDPVFNYLKNASGLNITHPTPQVAWHGTERDYKKYFNYYSTMTAAASFNGYVMGQQWTEAQNDNAFSKAQADLVRQVSTSDWLATVATEPIGQVLRQLLMFESQLYILITQLVQTQKQLLTAQVINNSILIAANQLNESILVAKAEGQPIS